MNNTKIILIPTMVGAGHKKNSSGNKKNNTDHKKNNTGHKSKKITNNTTR